MRTIKMVGRLCSRVLTVFLALLLACNLYVIGARQFAGIDHPEIFGWSWAVVISGSMEPRISVNDLIVIHASDSYEPGDVVTFRSGENIVTHRIVERTAEGFITRGDANNTEDVEPVPQSRIIGKVLLTVPGVGLMIEYLRTPLGMLAMVLVAFALIELPYLFQGRGKEDEE